MSSYLESTLNEKEGFEEKKKIITYNNAFLYFLDFLKITLNLFGLKEYR